MSFELHYYRCTVVFTEIAHAFYFRYYPKFSLMCVNETLAITVMHKGIHVRSHHRSVISSVTDATVKNSGFCFRLRIALVHRNSTV